LTRKTKNIKEIQVFFDEAHQKGGASADTVLVFLQSDRVSDQFREGYARKPPKSTFYKSL
jgi:hypothetical protein